MNPLLGPARLSGLSIDFYLYPPNPPGSRPNEFCKHSFFVGLATALRSTQCVANAYPLGAIKLAEKIFRIFISPVGYEPRSE